VSRVLITGATGFAGSHLIDLLLQEKGIEVFGARRHRSDLDNVEHVFDKVRWVIMEITEQESVSEVVKEVSPDVIFHLAAKSYVPDSWTCKETVLSVNLGGTVNLLEAVRQHVPKCRVHIACSSEQYGLVFPSECPIDESNPFRPRSIYAVSKIGAEAAGLHYFYSYGINVLITRAFNHTGPRRHELFVCSTFAHQVARVKLGLQKKIKVGNLEAYRDFTDVRDMVRAYYLCVMRGNAGTPYVVASGKTVQVREILDLLVDIAGIKVDDIEEDPKRMRPSDVPLLHGDASKFRRDTGWNPRFDLQQTLIDLYNWALQRVRKEAAR